MSKVFYIRVVECPYVLVVIAKLAVNEFPVSLRNVLESLEDDRYKKSKEHHSNDKRVREKVGDREELVPAPSRVVYIQ